MTAASGDIAVISRVNRPRLLSCDGISKKRRWKRPSPFFPARAAQELCMKEYVSTLVPGDICERQNHPSGNLWRFSRTSAAASFLYYQST